MRRGTAPECARLFHQLLPAADRRPGAGGDGGLSAAGHHRCHDGLPDCHLLVGGHPGTVGGASTHAQPGGFVHRGRRHPAGHPWFGTAGVARLHGPGPARPAWQHPGAAAGQLAWRARPVSQCTDGTGDRDVDRAGVHSVAAGPRHAPAPEGRAGPGRCAGLSQGDGGFAGDRSARTRPAGPHHLRQPGVLPDGGFQRRGAAGAERQCALLAAGAGRRVPQAPEHPAGGQCAAARGF